MSGIALGKGPWYLRTSVRLGVAVGVLLLVGGGFLAWHMNPAQALTLQDGLIAHWKLDEASSGATAVDSSGNGHDGTPTGDADGGVLPQPSTSVPSVDFSDTHSLAFDGNDDAVTTNLSLNGTPQFSAAGWIYPVSAGNRMSFFGQNDVFEFGFSDSTHITCYVGTGTSISWAFTSETFPLNQWHHVACTNSGTAQVLYVDGVAVATGSTTVTTGSSTDKFALGSGAWDPLGTSGGNFNGKLDDVHVYNRALTGSEIGQLRTAGSDAPTTTLTGGSAVTHGVGTTASITDLQVAASSGNPDVSLKLFVSSGTISMTTTTGLTFYNADGTPRAGQPSGSADLQFSGSLSDVNAALATLQYVRTSGSGTDTLSASLVQPGEVFFSGNDHLYEYVAGPVTWSQAKTNAESLSKYGATGYLATITSQEENDFIKNRLKSDSWIGASDAAVEGEWRWVTGPESGQQFWQGTGSGNTVGGMYAHWNNPKTGGSGAEPNQSGEEDCAEFYYSNNGLWNDLSCSNTLGYIVEYGAPGNLPTVSSKDVSITTIADTTPPSTPGTPSVSSPTADATPTVSWTASADSGTGLKNPAYTLEWSASSTFASVAGSATTNATILAPPSNLSDGTWYFRVKATDNASNTATSGISGAVVIDTTGPTRPGTPSVAITPTNDNTPTWNWSASTDSGTGLADIAYGVEWSQDTSFFGLGGTAGVTENSYEIPSGLHMTDGTWYFRVRAIDALGNVSAWSDAGTVVVDTATPAISNIIATPTDEQAVITWTTNKDASSKVSYGPTAALGTDTAEVDTTSRIQSHSVTLDNLVPCSVYHFTVTSRDAAGNSTTSGDGSFITKGCAGSAEVISYADTMISTASGGNVSFDTVKVDVPAGFAAVNADFQVKKIEHGPAFDAIGTPAGMLLAGNSVYDIKALQNGTVAITSFTKPITITLRYSDAEIAALAESSLAIYRWDAGVGWTKLDNCSVDVAANAVTCTTTHFSTFALYGQAKPAAFTATNGNLDDNGVIGRKGQMATTAPDAKATDGAGLSADDTLAEARSDTEKDTSAMPGDEMDTTTSGEGTAGSHAGFSWWWLAALAVVAGFFWWLVAWRRRRKKDSDDS